MRKINVHIAWFAAWVFLFKVFSFFRGLLPWKLLKAIKNVDSKMHFVIQLYRPIL